MRMPPKGEAALQVTHLHNGPVNSAQLRVSGVNWPPPLCHLADVPSEWCPMFSFDCPLIADRL